VLTRITRSRRRRRFGAISAREAESDVVDVRDDLFEQLTDVVVVQLVDHPAPVALVTTSSARDLGTAHEAPRMGVGEVEYQVVRVNAEYADQASDHDPQVVRLQP
jgi:hypothetical protein